MAVDGVREVDGKRGELWCWSSVFVYLYVRARETDRETDRQRQTLVLGETDRAGDADIDCLWQVSKDCSE